MKVLIASENSAAELVRQTLDGAGLQVDIVPLNKLSATRQRSYDFVMTDAAPSDGALRNGNIELYIDKHVVRRNKKTIKLTPLEFRIMQFFIEQRGGIVTRRDLAAECWRKESGTSDNTIEVYIKRLRMKFGTSCIRTIHGVGYQMDKK